LGQRVDGGGMNTGSRRGSWGCDLFNDLLANYRSLAWGVDAESDAIAFDLKNGDSDVVADEDGLRESAGEYEHILCSIRHYNVDSPA
jgi:hypothetical protein